MDNQYQLEIVEEESYVYATLSGDNVTYQDILQALHKIADHCKKHKHTRLLYESKITTDLSFHHMEQIANQLTALGFDSIICAVLIASPERQFNIDFGVNIANARGSHFHLFINRDSAIEWLMESELPTER